MPIAERTAAELEEGREFVVTGLTGDAFLRERLAELGFAPGVEARVLRKAPLGGAVQVALRSGSFAVRADEAACVTVDTSDAACPSCASACSLPAMATFQRMAVKPTTVALAGNPNVGKSSLFNALTGLRQRVGNYPGVTVERVSGTATTPEGDVEIVDLPGAYSLLPASPDERVARDALLGTLEGAERPDLIVVVLDAGNLDRSLFLATQILELGRPVVFALNQIDVAARQGIRVDDERLSAAFSVPVVSVCGRIGDGAEGLLAEIARGGAVGRPLVLDPAPPVAAAAEGAAGRFASALGGPEPARRALIQALQSERGTAEIAPGDAELRDWVISTRATLEAEGLDIVCGAAIARYDAIDGVVAAVREQGVAPSGRQAAADRVLTHPASGTAIMLAVFAAIFAVVYWVADPAIGWIDDAFGSLADTVAAALGDGWLSSFVADGVLAGIGGFLVFVPQIALLFLCVHALEDSGYLARAAFLLDRLMGSVGLPGRSFVPLLSGFACAIPGIMAARTIENRRERLLTIAVLPWMSCAARMPVYLLIVGALFAPFGPWAPVSVILSMYVLGIVAAFAGAKLLRVQLLEGRRTPLLLELPPYRRPSVRSVLLDTGRRTWAFVRGAGPIIVALTIVMWAGLYFPRSAWTTSSFDSEIAALEAAPETPQSVDRLVALQNQRTAEQTANSYLGRAGRVVEPVIEPLGYDWKIGVGIIASFAAREVFVPTLGVVYAVGDEAGEDDQGLLDSMRNDRRPDGSPVFTPLVGISILVFYVLAMQCLSTIAVIKRETGGWTWPIGVLVGHTVIAYLAALLVFQIGTLLGY